MSSKTLPSKAEVLNKLFSQWQPPERTETVPLAQAFGRVTAETLKARFDLPVVRASMMDGVAVDSTRFQNGAPDTSSWQEGADYVRADTGDDFDDCFDAVIAVEQVTFLDGGGLRIDDDVDVQANMRIRGVGSWVKKGSELVQAHTLLRAVDIAALAMGGIDNVPVIRKPVVAFVPSGSELVSPGTVPQRGQNINSNSLMLEQLLREAGAQPLILPIVRDDQQQLAQTLVRALQQADIVVIGGGSSKGGEDFCAEMLKEQGELITHGVAAAPGRPLCMVLIDGKPVVNLPGPVIAAFYGFDWCLQAMVGAWLGVAMPQRRKANAQLTEELSCSDKMSMMYRLSLCKNEQGILEATPMKLGASGTAQVLCADGIYISTPGESVHEKGATITVELLQ